METERFSDMDRNNPVRLKNSEVCDAYQMSSSWDPLFIWEKSPLRRAGLRLAALIVRRPWQAIDVRRFLPGAMPDDPVSGMFRPEPSTTETCRASKLRVTE